MWEESTYDMLGREYTRTSKVKLCSSALSTGLLIAICANVGTDDHCKLETKADKIAGDMTPSLVDRECGMAHVRSAGTPSQMFPLSNNGTTWAPQVTCVVKEL